MDFLSSNISRPRWQIFRRQVAAHNHRENLQELVESVPFASAHVEYHAFHVWGLACKQIGRDDVVDKSEVARLFAVTVDLRGLTRERRQNKARDHARIWRVGILPWAENVEIAQRDRG